MIAKVISGGQVGADIAALRAAKKLGIETGGWMPKGFRTLKGSRYEYEDLYEMWEHEDHRYPPRTYANVEMADATLRIAVTFNSPGERCTLAAIEQFKKPHLDVKLPAGLYDVLSRVSITPRAVRKWLGLHAVKILNVAGNAREDIEPIVEQFVIEVLRGA